MRAGLGRALLRRGPTQLLKVAALAALAAVQAWIVADGSFAKQAGRVWGLRGEPSLERSARVAFGDEFAEFISFVRRTVPESAKLVVPSKAVEPVFGDIGLLQYFLRPRKIIDCPMGADTGPCIRSMTGETTYLLAVPGFPPPADAALYREFVAFDAERGVYVPRVVWAGGDIIAAEDPASVVRPSVRTWTLDLLALATFAAIGLLLCRAFLPEADPLLLVAISLPLGVACVTWVVFLLAWAGLPLTLPAYLGAGLGLLVMALAAWLRQRRHPIGARPGRGPASPGSSGGDSRIGWSIGVLLLSVSLAVSVGRSYSGWDDMAAYAVQGYGMAREGTLQASLTWGPSAAGYPLNIPLAITAFHLLDGDVLPGSKLLFPFFLSAVLLMGYRTWRRAGHSDLHAGCLMLGLGTTSLVLDQSTMGYTNLPFTAYLLMGVALTLEGLVQGSGETRMLGGLMLGAAVWTRPEGWTLVWGIYLPVLVVGVLSRKGKGNLPAFSLVAAITLLWMLFRSTTAGGGQTAEAFRTTIELVAAGNFRLEAVYWTLRNLGRILIDPDVCGLFLPASFILMLIVPWRSACRRREAFGLAAAGIWAGLIILGLFYVVSSTMDLLSWLGSSVDRMFLPAIVLGWVGLGGLAAARMDGRTGNPEPRRE